VTEVRSRDTMTGAIRDAHRYHDWVFEACAKGLRPGSALEVGSGHGRFSRRLAPSVRELYVSDIDPRAVDEISAELTGLSNVRFLVMDGVEPDKLPSAVDNILMINVLEHIADDRSTLRSCHEALAPGGALIVFVPAFHLLYSRMDSDAGHHRRYEREELREVLTGAGFAIKELRFFNAIGFFGWLANKWVGSAVNGASANAQVKLYDQAIPFFRHADRALPFIGQSLLAIAEKSA
jgi:SAM-dependent methyltransferase